MNITRNTDNTFTVTNIQHVNNKYTFNCRYGKYGELLESKYKKVNSNKEYVVPDNWSNIIDHLNSIGSAYSV